MGKENGVQRACGGKERSQPPCPPHGPRSHVEVFVFTIGTMGNQCRILSRSVAWGGRVTSYSLEKIHLDT